MVAIPSNEELANAAERGRHDPVWWVRTMLGHDPWPRQCDILESVRDNRRTAVKSCHGAGKSFCSGEVALWYLFNHYPSIVLTTAPTARQVEGILWKEIRSAHKKAPADLGGRVLRKQIQLDDDWFAWGFTARDYNADSFQGWHEKHILAIVDESSGVTPTIFEGIDGVMSSQFARELDIGNPTNPNGVFASRFRQPSVAKISITAFETPNFTAPGITEEDIENGKWRAKLEGVELPYPGLVTPQWVADKFEYPGPASPFYLSRVLAQFPKEGPDTLIPLSWIEEAQNKTLEAQGTIRLGLDVAREGDDETACYRNQGGVIRRVFVSRKERTNITTGRARNAYRDEKADQINVDVIGIGAGVFDALDEDPNINALDVNFGSASVDPERFANLKAQLYWSFREAVEAGEIDLDPEDEDLAAQASSIKWKPDRKGRIAIESKEEHKKRTRKSPDRFEAAVYSQHIERAQGDDWAFSW